MHNRAPRLHFFVGSPVTSRSAAPRRTAAQATMFAALSLVAGLATGSSGCSSDSKDKESPFAEFEGTWRFNADMRNQVTLSCPTLMPPFVGEFPLFTKLTMERGTIADVFESAGPGDCQFSFNKVANMKALSLVTPDPFSAAVPQCVALSLGSAPDPMTGNTIETVLVVRPTTWAFNLQMPVQGKAPTAQLAGDAMVNIVDVDIDAVPNAAVGTSACTYTVAAFYDKVSQ